MAAMMQKRAAFANRSASAVSPSTRNLVVARYAQSLSASDLAAFKIVDLVEIAKKKGVSGGRDATRDTLTNAILRAGVSLSDLTKGQLAELKAKNPSAASSSSSYSAPAGGRFSSYSNGASSGSRASAPASSGATLSAGDLSAFKIVDLVEIAGKKGVSAGRNATRDSLTSALARAGVTLNDLTRGQLGDLGIKLGEAGLPRDINQARAKLASLIGGSGSAPASWRSTPTPTAANDRFANYSRSSTPSYGGASSGSSGARLGAGDLAHLPIDDLRDLVKKTGAELPREPTKDGVISALVSKGVSLDHLTRGMLVALSTKMGAPLAKDINGLKANLSSRVGGGSSGSSSSWRSTPAPSHSSAPAGGDDRWAKYSAGSTQKASWRRSGSHNASGSKLSAGDLAHLRIDDLRDLVKKTGAELPREPTKDGVVSALLQKGVSLNDLTRGMLVDLANKLGTPLARDVDSLRRNLSSAVGKGSYSPAAPATSTSSWRSAPSTPAPASNDRWASYSRSSGSNGRGASSGGAVYEADLQNFKIDMLSEMARKKGISMRNATKDSLVSQLVKSITLADLSRGQLIEILSNINQSTNGSVEDLRSRVAAASSQRQSARSRSLAGSRW